MDTTLNYQQARHLVSIEPTRNQAFDFVDHLLEGGQITLAISAQLKVFADGKFNKERDPITP